MRICLVASSRFPVREPFVGGLEAHTAALADGLTRRGHQVTLCAAPGSDPRFRVRELATVPFEPDVGARSDVGTTPATWLSEHHAYLGLFLDLARGGREHFDVVHNNSLHHLPVAMSSLLDLPVVTTLHTPPVGWLESAMAYAGPDARFVAVSRHTARSWRHAVRPTVVLNGVDTDRWLAGPGGERAVWTGRLVPEKAPHVAIDAAVRAGMPLDLAGAITDPTYFAEQVRPRLGGDVRYLGHLGVDDLVALVGSSAVAIVSPSWDEPYGLVAAEALSCGTPVAAVARGAVPEVVSEVGGVLARPGDVGDLARAVTTAVGLPRAAVRRDAVRRLGVDRMVGEYEATYARSLEVAA